MDAIYYVRVETTASFIIPKTQEYQLSLAIVK